MAKAREKKLDRALDMTFPASDPIAVGKPTGTEKPPRPPARPAPDRRNDDHKPEPREKRARQRHRGMGRAGLSSADRIERSGNEQGLGGEGADEEHKRK